MLYVSLGVGTILKKKNGVGDFWIVSHYELCHWVGKCDHETVDCEHKLAVLTSVQRPKGSNNPVLAPGPFSQEAIDYRLWAEDYNKRFFNTGSALKATKWCPFDIVKNFEVCATPSTKEEELKKPKRLLRFNR